jgi:hypothetical protein
MLQPQFGGRELTGPRSPHCWPSFGATSSAIDAAVRRSRLALAVVILAFAKQAHGQRPHL